MPLPVDEEDGEEVGVGVNSCVALDVGDKVTRGVWLMLCVSDLVRVEELVGEGVEVPTLELVGEGVLVEVVVPVVLVVPERVGLEEDVEVAKGLTVRVIDCEPVLE